MSLYAGVAAGGGVRGLMFGLGMGIEVMRMYWGGLYAMICWDFLDLWSGE